MFHKLESEAIAARSTTRPRTCALLKVGHGQRPCSSPSSPMGSSGSVLPVAPLSWPQNLSKPRAPKLKHLQSQSPHRTSQLKRASTQKHGKVWISRGSSGRTLQQQQGDVSKDWVVTGTVCYEFTLAEVRKANIAGIDWTIEQPVSLRTSEGQTGIV